MKKIFPILLLILICLNSQAQTDSSSIETILFPNDTIEVDRLNEKAYRFLYINSDSILKYANKALSLSKSLNYVRGQAFSYMRMGLAYQTKGDLSKSFLNFQKALFISQEINDPDLTGRVLANIGLVYGAMENYKKAIDYIQRAGKIFEELNDDVSLYRTFVYTGEYYIQLGEFDQAKMVLLKCDTIETSNERDIWHYHIDLAWYNLEVGNSDIADSILNNAWRINENSSENLFKGMSCYFWSRISMNKSNVNRAEEFARDGIEYFKLIDNKEWLSRCFKKLSEFAAIRSDYSMAYTLINTANQLKDNVQNANIHYLAEIFESEQNDLQLTLLHNQKELEVNRKEYQRNIFIAVTIIFVIGFIGFGVNIYFKIRDNRKLNLQKSIIESQNHELQKTNNKLIQQQKEVSEHRDILNAQKEKLEKLNRKLAESKEEIAKQNEHLETQVKSRTEDLVSYINQLEQYSFITAHNLRAPVARIAGLAHILELDHSEEDADKIISEIVSASKEIDKVITELNLILEIRNSENSILEKVNLKSELNNVKTTLKAEIIKTNTKIKSDFSQIDSITSVKPFISSILYNLVSNSIKYHHPDRTPIIELKTKIKDDTVVITIMDNGIGIDLEKHGNKIFDLYNRAHSHVDGRGVGLFMVKSQIEQLNGKVQVLSELDQGTTINIEFPIN